MALPGKLRRIAQIGWGGHDFIRTAEPFILVLPSGLQPARNLLFRLHPQAARERVRLAAVPFPMKEATLLLAGLFALTAGWTDWRSRRIPNWLTVSALLIGLSVNTISAGWQGAVAALEGAGLGLLLLFPFVILRVLGAGDWKLVGAMGAFLGPRPLLTVLIVALLVAGIMALVLVIYKGRLGQTIRNIGHLLLAFASGRPGDPSISLDNPHAAKVPFGVAFAVAVILYLGQKVVLASWSGIA